MDTLYLENTGAVFKECTEMYCILKMQEPLPRSNAR